MKTAENLDARISVSPTAQTVALCISLVDRLYGADQERAIRAIAAYFKFTIDKHADK